jgi:predicted Zn-dependent peptidase
VQAKPCRTIFDNRLTLLTERIPTVRSASIGIWVKRGSRDEPQQHNGVAHFVEHMLFKGTSTRSARDIALEIDAMGGQLDAFTSHELAGYYAQVLDERLSDAFDLLADLICNPRFEAAEMERERGVILEEIASAEDDPEDVLFESFLRGFWKEHPMGRPILGTPETVGRMRTEDLRDCVDAVGAADIVVTAAGNLDHEHMRQLIGERLSGMGSEARTAKRTQPKAHAHVRVLERQQLEQVQLYVACEAPSGRDGDRFAAQVLNALLGGTVSSRLFQSIREERGLAYSVYSTMAPYSDTGYLLVSAGTRPPHVEQVVSLILEETRRLQQLQVTDEELARVKAHLKGSLVLSLEGTSGRMAALARAEINFGRVFELERVLEGIDAVGPDDVRRIARRLFAGELSAGFIARRDAAEKLRSIYEPGGLLAGEAESGDSLGGYLATDATA